jgi:hypothetical protein
MEQLQLIPPEEEKTTLDANIQEQLLTVMAEIILAIIAVERNIGHDHKQS